MINPSNLPNSYRERVYCHLINPYRYGFNGKEKDDEIKGNSNSLDFGARIYDPRLGIFLSIDPLISKYPMLSSYCFAANSPIKFVDEDGKGPQNRISYAATLVGTPYRKQTGTANRIENTPVGLEYLDCSEFVSRVLAADGITSKVISRTSGGMATFFQTSGLFHNTMTDPQPGDFYAYEGHVGMVESSAYNKKGEWIGFNVLEAIDTEHGMNRMTKKIKSIIEKKGDSWIGFFRPITETPDNGMTPSESPIAPSVNSTSTASQSDKGIPNLPAPKATREEEAAKQSLPDRGASLKKNSSEPRPVKPKPSKPEKKLYSGG